jgi:type I restriction enzyme R subunit
MSQFSFLQPDFPEVFSIARHAETVALSDARTACIHARLAIETAVRWMYAADKTLNLPYQDNLASLIHDDGFVRLVGRPLSTKLKIIKDYGNTAAHDGRKTVQPAVAVTVLRELFHFCFWLVRTYGRVQPAPELQFSANALPKTTHIEVPTLHRLQGLLKQHEENLRARKDAEEARRASEEGRQALEAENKRLQDEIAAIKQANAAIPDTHDYNEEQTRDTFIDLLLHEAGWTLTDSRDREFPVTGMPNDSGTGRVDYVLWGDDGKPLALVEAKRTRKDARTGQQQAKLYADCLEQAFGQRPVIFYTNGHEHWLWDDVRYPPRTVQGFLKKDDLMWLHQRRQSQKPLESVPIETKIAGRPYQTRAIRRVGEVFEGRHQRKALLVMATGSGKTRTVIALVDQLLRAQWVKRVLFLADRRALVKQAHNAFKEHLRDVPSANLLNRHDPKENDHSGARVLLSTYPTILNLIDETENGVRRFGPGHFDLIVVDEAHRSIYRKYKAIFDYFDALLVGLTATPRDEIDRDTYGLFELERGVPTDAYELTEAVADGFLVPPVVSSVPLKFEQKGIRYDDLSDEEKAQWDELDWGEDGPPDAVDAGDLNRFLFNEDTVDKVLAHLMTNGYRVNEGERLGKTIIFAKNHKHAQFIAERFDRSYPDLKGSFASVIDNQISYAETLIDSFSAPHKLPQIAISVDMLDTGIDVPEVLNLVFFKIVRSRTKFWQMIGRGTRLCPDLFGPGRDKTDFRIFDFCQNFEFFSQNPDVKDTPVGPSLSQKLFQSRLDLIAAIDVSERPAELAGVREQALGHLQDEVRGMTLDNFIVRPKRPWVEKYQQAEAWQTLDLATRSELSEHLAPLPSAAHDTDKLEAKQFDFLVFSAMLALLRREAAFTRYQGRIIEVAAALQSLGSVPVVRMQMELILAVQTDEYWEGITLPILEELRCKLRNLVSLIQPGERKIVYSDFEDEIGTATEMVLPEISNGTDMPRFRMKVRQFLNKHANHISILKLRRNEQLTPQDIAELERVFREEGAENEDLELARAEGGLALLIRQLVGLDRHAAKEAFAEFMQTRTLNANQMEFVNLIINELTKNGIMLPERLYQSPFVDMNTQGVDGLFPSTDVHALVQVLDTVRRKLAA